MKIVRDGKNIILTRAERMQASEENFKESFMALVKDEIEEKCLYDESAFNIAEHMSEFFMKNPSFIVEFHDSDLYELAENAIEEMNSEETY